ncbi:MAG: hypothetical protein IT355_10650 [Gemmatimonadaceae bacterium]|nr:hypothetical protein [Gemmatimonadaceae bacterium]
MLTPLPLDLRMALTRAECDLYSNLVTRATGRAVRGQLESMLQEMPGKRLAVLDFSHVGVLDFSCADEIVAQLLLRWGAGLPAHSDVPQLPAYFMFRGLADAHLEALEPVLERHGLALVAEAADGSMQLVGIAAPEEHAVWQLVLASGGGDVEAIASFAGEQRLDLHERLVALARRRLVIQTAAGFHPLRHH